jgi:nicotinate-nucleotide adenylyltransferase
MAQKAQEHLDLDRILFLPCNQQPLKTTAPAAAPFHRAAMVALAIQGRHDWVLEAIELERSGVSYTAETMEALSSRLPGEEFFLIMGQDSFDTLGRWYRYETILQRAALAVVPREGASRGSPPPSLSGGRVTFLQCPSVAASSTTIRERIAEGSRVDDLTPPAVAAYIYKQDLYRG